MKIALVSEHASPLAMPGSHPDAGGQNVHVNALARALARLGCEVVVHTRRTDPRAPRRVQLAPGLLVDHVDAGAPEPIFRDDLFPLMDEFSANLAHQWRVDRPDVVHAHFWMSGYAALSAAWPLGIPVVQTFHALGVVKRRNQGVKDTSPPARVSVEPDLCRRVDHIIATCSDEVFELLRLGATLSRVTVAPCGVDLDLFHPDGPSEPRTGDRFRVVVAARLVERKGLGNTIEAIAHLPEAELVIAGGPPGEDIRVDPLYQRLDALAEDYGVSDRVEFRGFVAQHELPALLRSADAVACVPWYEPFGIAALEASACGVPVVASAVGGLTDTVVDGITGIHVPPRSPEDLARALRFLMENPEIGRAYGRAGARRARSRYSWSRVAAHTFDVYRALVSDRRTALESQP